MSRITPLIIALVVSVAGLAGCAEPTKRFYVVQQKDMMNWTRDAVGEAMTFSAPNPEGEVSTARRHFTTRGWLEFRDALDKQRLLETARLYDLQVTGRAGEPSVLEAEGAQGDGTYAWQVELPLELAMRSPASLATGGGRVMVRVVQDPEKLAIDTWRVLE